MRSRASRVPYAASGSNRLFCLKKTLNKKRSDNPKHKFRLHTVAAFRLWRGFEEYFERHPTNGVNLNYIRGFVNLCPLNTGQSHNKLKFYNCRTKKIARRGPLQNKSKKDITFLYCRGTSTHVQVEKVKPDP